MDKDKEDIKKIMDATTTELVSRMDELKFRKKIFKQSKLFSSKEVVQASKDWETLKYESKIEWFDTILFKTKDKDGKENPKAYDEILMLTTMLQQNKFNLGKTWRELKLYGDIKKNEK